MEFPSQIEINSLQETKKLANYLYEILNPGSIVVLNGDLGTGKTTLVKAICSKYNIQDVTSPSFSIVNEYSGIQKIFHFDFYRLKKIEELYDIGFEEYLSDESAITFIEWGELFPEALPKNHIAVKISFKNENMRLVELFHNH